jgi:hypothetical protein
VDRIIITIEGPNFQDREEAEVMGLPEEGEMINTKYGPCPTATSSAARSLAGCPSRTPA